MPLIMMLGDRCGCIIRRSQSENTEQPLKVGQLLNRDVNDSCIHDERISRRTSQISLKSLFVADRAIALSKLKAMIFLNSSHFQCSRVCRSPDEVDVEGLQKHGAN
jgi:hypothetical protein